MEEFTHSEPEKGFEWEYLERAKKMLSLYEQARAIYEDNLEDSSEIQKLLEQVKRLMQKCEKVALIF